MTEISEMKANHCESYIAKAKVGGWGVCSGGWCLPQEKLQGASFFIFSLDFSKGIQSPPDD